MTHEIKNSFFFFFFKEVISPKGSWKISRIREQRNRKLVEMVIKEEGKGMKGKP